jgi:hypothetical protein
MTRKREAFKTSTRRAASLHFRSGRWDIPIHGVGGGLLLGFGLSVAPLVAADFFVSPHGSDQHPGTLDLPFATLHQAVRALKPGDVCYLREGVYREVLRPMTSGAPGKEITFTPYRNEQVILTGADPIAGGTHESDGSYSAPMPWSLDDGNQVFADGEMLTEACWPNPGESALFQPIRAVAAAGSETSLVCPEIPGPADAWKGAQLWCAGGSAWICWTSTVTSYDEMTHTLTFDKARESWYTPTRGSQFSLRGIRAAMDAPGEWIYDTRQKRIILIPPARKAGAKTVSLEAKRRMDVIDLAGLSHIHIHGIQFRAGGIRMDKNSSHLVLKNLRGKHVSHSYQNNTSTHSGVLIDGKNNLLLNCDLGYSSSSVLSVTGEDHRIINCHIHHGGYAGLWRGTVSLSGRRILFSHNTVQHAGRDLVNTHGLMESLVQFNQVSDAGWLTKDLGMFYGHNTDYANTRFCYNLVHDNHADHCAMGIYFDHLSHNAIVDHNVIWNAASDPIRINNPSYNCLVFHNSCWQSGGVTTFDHTKRDDLFGSRFTWNIFNQPIQLPAHVILANNLVSATPPYADAAKQDFRIAAGHGHQAGAYPPGAPPWKAGCDLNDPPTPLPVYVAPAIPWMNAIQNACFEFGTLEAWQRTDAENALLVTGNGWGNNHGKTNEHATGTSKHELRLGPGRDGVRQLIRGLLPDTRYTLSAWAKVSAGETLVLAVSGHGAPPVEETLASSEWKRLSIEFKTGSHAHEAMIFLLKSSHGNGSAWCDNLTLPMTPESTDPR